MLERGRRFKHTDFKQSMYIEHLSNVYNLIQSHAGHRRRRSWWRTAWAAARTSTWRRRIRSPRETFERRDHHPDDGPDRRMWPKEISRRTLDPYYRRAERALRVRQPSLERGVEVGRPVGGRRCDAAGHTCDRVPLAIDFGRCVDAKWCHTGCIFGAKNTVTTNYLGAAERAGVRVRPDRQVEQRAAARAPTATATSSPRR